MNGDPSDQAPEEQGVQDFSERFAKVNGVCLRYLIGGTGSPVVLLPGYAEAKLMASDVRGQVVPGVGHWLMEEAPRTVIRAIADFVR